MRLTIIILATLSSGAFAGIAIGMCANIRPPLYLAIPFALLFVLALGAAWFFSPDGPLYEITRS
jgi:hypothetical protein